MNRTTALAVVAVCLAIAGVLAGVLHLLRRDRAAQAERFASERTAQVAEAAREIEEDLEDIRDDLGFAGQLVLAADSAADRERDLRALLAVVRQYRVAGVYDREGREALVVIDPITPLGIPATARGEMRESALRAAARPVGTVEQSHLLRSDPGGWYRVFATPLPDGGGAVALLVDTEPLFGKLRLVTALPGSLLLVVGPHGRPLPVSDPGVTAAVRDDGAGSPALARVVAGLRSGIPGTTELAPDEAAAVGLDRARAVAAWSPIHVQGSRHWALATVRSTASLRTSENALLLRLGLASGGISLCLIGFGAYVITASRKAVALRERLRSASHVAQLQSQLVRAEKLATVGVLAAGIAHEVGTPLGVVRGRAEYLLGKLGGEHPQAASARVIVEQIDRVSRTLRELLDFSRTKPIAARSVDFAATARSVADLLSFEAARKDVAIEVRVPDGLPALAADPDQIQQVLVNLIMNACDAARPGGRVVVTAEPAPAPGGAGGAPRARIAIEDDGCGIASENLERVFDPFFTTKKRGQGTGLGLTIAAQIVRSHGGEIELASEPGRGTRVVLAWPAARGEEAHDAAKS
jgi:signal transduction histidine kinase